MSFSSLYGKLVIVTGSARGLGEGFAEAVLKAGGKVTVSDVLDKEGQETAKRFGDRYGKDKVYWCHCDVTSESDWTQLWESTEAYFGGQTVDMLVNNAGINHKFGWKKCMDVDIIGVMIGTELARERFVKSGKKDGGHIINIASVAGLVPSLSADGTCYFVAKAGVVSLTRSLGCPPVFGQQNRTRVDCICPIFADTAIVTAHEDIKETALARGPLLTVDRVVEAFTTLANSPGSGRTLVVLHDSPFIYWPNQSTLLLTWLGMGAKLVQKVMPGTQEFTPTLQAAWLLVTLFLVFLLFKIFLGILF